MEDLLFVVTIWLIGLATPIIGIASLKFYRIILRRNEDLETSVTWPKIFQKKEKIESKNNSRVCQICGEPGHYAKTCPQRVKQ